MPVSLVRSIMSLTLHGSAATGRVEECIGVSERDARCLHNSDAGPRFSSLHQGEDVPVAVACTNACLNCSSIQRQRSKEPNNNKKTNNSEVCGYTVFNPSGGWAEGQYTRVHRLVTIRLVAAAQRPPVH